MPFELIPYTEKLMNGRFSHIHVRPNLDKCLDTEITKLETITCLLMTKIRPYKFCFITFFSETKMGY